MVNVLVWKSLLIPLTHVVYSIKLGDWPSISGASISVGDGLPPENANVEEICPLTAEPAPPLVDEVDEGRIVHE